MTRSHNASEYAGQVCKRPESTMKSSLTPAMWNDPLALYRNAASERQFKLFRSTLLSWVISST
jgi:hypothetical protein